MEGELPCKKPLISYAGVVLLLGLHVVNEARLSAIFTC